MKATLLSLVFACLFVTTYAQVDLKINPIGALFGSPDVSADFALSEKFSVEGGLGTNIGDESNGLFEFKRSGFSAFAAGRTYFNPEMGADKFGVGLYTRFRNIKYGVEGSDDSSNNYTQNRFAVGLMAGWKWVSDKNIIFEFDLGAGRNFVNKTTFDDETNSTIGISDIDGSDLDVMIRLIVGYRIGG